MRHSTIIKQIFTSNLRLMGKTLGQSINLTGKILNLLQLTKTTSTCSFLESFSTGLSMIGPCLSQRIMALLSKHVSSNQHLWISWSQRHFLSWSLQRAPSHAWCNPFLNLQLVDFHLLGILWTRCSNRAVSSLIRAQYSHCSLCLRKNLAQTRPLNIISTWRMLKSSLVNLELTSFLIIPSACHGSTTLPRLSSWRMS
jgi:hypothetical protein